METTLNKLTITQNIALYWLRHVESGLLFFESGLLFFKLLQTLSKPFRIAFYIGLIAFTVFGMKFIFIFIPEYNNSLWQILRDILFYGAALGISLVITIESVLKLDVAGILKEKKAKVAEIKKNKLQRWRLRNMNTLKRIFVYLFFYAVLLFWFETTFYAARVDLFGAAPLTPQIYEVILEFNAAYMLFIKWFTFSFFIAALTLDYFVNKTRAKRKIIMEAKNETY